MNVGPAAWGWQDQCSALARIGALMQYRPRLIDGLLAKTGLASHFVTTTIEDL